LNFGKNSPACTKDKGNSMSQHAQMRQNWTKVAPHGPESPPPPHISRKTVPSWGYGGVLHQNGYATQWRDAGDECHGTPPPHFRKSVGVWGCGAITAMIQSLGVWGVLHENGYARWRRDAGGGNKLVTVPEQRYSTERGGMGGVPQKRQRSRAWGYGGCSTKTAALQSVGVWGVWLNDGCECSGKTVHYTTV
jgi:hypothetical protein